MPAFKPGEDPRKVFRQRHRERGPSRLFTFRDLAEAANEAPTTTRSRLRTTTDARTAARYIIEALARGSVKLTDAQAIALLGNVTLPEWRARWPRFDLYRCGYPACATVTLEPGLCAAHGGPIRPAVTIRDDHFMLWTGREYTAICHVIFGVASTVPIEHLDRNAWNSHPDNLRASIDQPHRTRRQRWTYGYQELAALFGFSEEAARQVVARGILDPASLSSICAFWATRR